MLSVVALYRSLVYGDQQVNSDGVLEGHVRDGEEETNNDHVVSDGDKQVRENIKVVRDDDGIVSEYVQLVRNNNEQVRVEDGLLSNENVRVRNIDMVAPEALLRNIRNSDDSDDSLNLSLASSRRTSSSSSSSSFSRCDLAPTQPLLADVAPVESRSTGVTCSDPQSGNETPPEGLTQGCSPVTSYHVRRGFGVEGCDEAPCVWQCRKNAIQGRAGKGRYVPPPTAPPPQRTTRCQTEPPNLASPDLLQVSWEWDTRPTRAATMKRRPSRRPSCRWKTRPRPIPRRPSGCHTLLAVPVKCDSQRDPLRGVDWIPIKEGVQDVSRVRMVGPDYKDPPQVRLRHSRPKIANITSDPTTSAMRSLKRKWRHSDLLPRLVTEAFINVKGGGDIKRQTILERPREMPLWMKRLSHLVLGDKDSTNLPTSTFYMNMFGEGGHGETGSRPRSIVSSSSHGSSGGRRRRSSQSPRCTLAPPRPSHHAVGWCRKQRRAMKQKTPPLLYITPPQQDTTPLLSEDTTSLLNEPRGTDRRCAGGVLGRLLDRLRPTSITPIPASPVPSRSSVSGGSEDGHSPSHSSDYEDHDELERTGSASLVGRMRGLRRDMQKKISRLKSPRGSTSSSPGGPLPSSSSDPSKPTPSHAASASSLAAPSHKHTPSAASYESLPSSSVPIGVTFVSAVGAPGSNRSSLSGEEAEPYTGPFIGRARALVDCHPSPYDPHALKFKKGDAIDIIAKNPSGLWQGCVDGRVGHFKFILVEEEVERPARKSRAGRAGRGEAGGRSSGGASTHRRGRPRTLEELLSRLHLAHLIQVFVLNGYEDLEQFREVERGDLACLGITEPETCAKLLTAVALLHDADESDAEAEALEATGAVLRRGDHGRDSGCYPDHRCPHPPVLDENNLDTRQSTPSTDNSSGYHSRGGYNIPMGDPALTTLPRDDPTHTLPRDDLPHDDSTPTLSQETPTTTSTLTSPPKESVLATEVDAGASSQTDGQSYRAHPAKVLPASPRTKPRQPHTVNTKRHDPQVDFEAKFASARSVFERESAKMGGPPGGPGRSDGSSPPRSSQEGEGEVRGPGEASVAAEVAP